MYQFRMVDCVVPGDGKLVVVAFFCSVVLRRSSMVSDKALGTGRKNECSILLVVTEVLTEEKHFTCMTVLLYITLFHCCGVRGTCLAHLFFFYSY